MAAQLTALARYTVRTAARSEARPSGVLDVLNRSLLDHETGDRFCTIVHAFIDTAEEPVRVTLSCAGHPLPLLVDAAGNVWTLGRPGTAVGLFATPALFDDTHRLLPGETLVLYTDGVVEARAPDGSFADGLLESVLRRSPRPAGRRHRRRGRVGHARVPGRQSPRRHGRAGDALARRPGSGSGWRRRPRASRPAAAACGRGWQADLGALGRTGVGRSTTSCWWRGSWAPTPSRRPAARSRCGPGPGPGSITVEVTDDGPGFDGLLPSAEAIPDPTSERGRGLFLVQSLTQDCRVQSGAHGTLVRCTIAASDGRR